MTGAMGPRGFDGRPGPPGEAPQDVDECVTGQHRCQHTCINTYLSYRCDCFPGYQLHSDMVSCTGENTGVNR